jgi:hypothetical protein
MAYASLNLDCAYPSAAYETPVLFFWLLTAPLSLTGVVLGGGRQKDRQILPIDEMVKHMRAWRRKLLLRGLLSLPRRVSRHVLELWAGQSAGQAAVVRTARSLLRI